MKHDKILKLELNMFKTKFIILLRFIDVQYYYSIYIYIFLLKLVAITLVIIKVVRYVVNEVK